MIIWDNNNPTPFKDMINQVICGDCLTILKGLPDKSINCCVTSPPYWGLRDYGQDGQIGLEKTPEEYVAKMVELFQEVRRVLKDDGTLWLNLGDSYIGGNFRYGTDDLGDSKQGTNKGSRIIAENFKRPNIPVGYKAKDLAGIPWRVAFALQQDGWYLRQDIIWHKPNPMPESVTDRCTKSHEYIFLMSKSAKYYFDNEAIKEKAKYGPEGEDSRPAGVVREREYGYDSKRNNNPESYSPHKNLKDKGQPLHTMHKKRVDKRAGKGRIAYGGKRNGKEGTGQESFVHIEEKRNKRSVWTVTTKPYSGAHFATFPEDLILPCILAGCPKGGIVLDSFMGAGTTALVAKKNGCNYIGCELNPEYIEIVNRRIAQEYLF